jgi:CRP/FNR family cyclic AMP-dependent transcriptional regulator
MVDQPMPNRRTEWPIGTLLSRLSVRSRADLLALGVARRVADGHILLREGGAGSHVVLLREALAKVTAATSNGRSTLLGIRVSGDVVGEMSAVSGEPRSATVTACGPSWISVIPRRDFQPFLETHPDAAVQLTAMVSKRLRDSNRRRVDFASYPVKVRLARVIAEIASAHGTPTQAGIVIAVPLSQPELASLCGAAEITVQKALRELREDGLVVTGYRRVAVLDLPRLLLAGELST